MDFFSCISINEHISIIITITIVLLLVTRLVVVYYDMHITVMPILLQYEK